MTHNSTQTCPRQPADRNWPSLPLAALSLAALLVSPASAHPFHVSIAEASWNADSQRLEFALQIAPDDLQRWLRQRSQPPVDSATTSTPQIDRILLQYLNEAIRLRSREGERRPLRWIGKEVTLKHVWLYFDAAVPEGLSGLQVTNRLFFELHPDQCNTVNFRQGDARQTLTFSRTRAAQTVSIGTQPSRADD